MPNTTPLATPKQTRTRAVKSLDQIIKTADTVRRMEKDLKDELNKLRRERKRGAVLIFDLKGSTKYRRRYGPEMGLHKAYLHNSTVSEAVVAAGGQVAKWLGDGVLAYFADGDERHGFRALQAALAALADLEALNQLEPLKGVLQADEPVEYVRIDHEIHTKVSICSGELHFFDSGSTGPGRVSPDDPMGSCVDLASRLSDVAEADVILVDRATFWGTPAVGPGICHVPEAQLSWRPLALTAPRETVYVPYVGAFLVEDDRLSRCRTAQAGAVAIGADDLVALAKSDGEYAGLPDAKIVYALKPVPCNVPGFEDPVEVLALSLRPHPAPVGESIHDWDDPHIKTLLADAERVYRSKAGAAEAPPKYQLVLAQDPRSFQANVRLAMLARAAKDSETAMRHLMAAKHSDPTCPLAWAVAGMTHLDDYIHDRNLGDALGRAVTGFTRGKVLAARGFHGLLEQYSTALLAIAHLLTPGDAAAAEGKRLLDELENWPAKTVTARCVIRLAEAFHKIRFRDPNAQTDIASLQREIDDNRPLLLEAMEKTPYDHVIRYDDIWNLLDRAEYKARVESPKRSVRVPT